MVFCLFLHTEWGANKKKLADRPKLNGGGGGFLASMDSCNVFLEKFKVLVPKILRRVHFFYRLLNNR
jgi:hypothetical protein